MPICLGIDEIDLDEVEFGEIDIELKREGVGPQVYFSRCGERPRIGPFLGVVSGCERLEIDRIPFCLPIGCNAIEQRACVVVLINAIFKAAGSFDDGLNHIGAFRRVCESRDRNNRARLEQGHQTGGVLWRGSRAGNGL